MHTRVHIAVLGCSLASLACHTQRNRSEPATPALREYVVDASRPIETERNWEFLRRRPGTDSAEQRIGAMRERESAVPGDSSQIMLIRNLLPPFSSIDTLIVDRLTLAPVEESSIAPKSRFHFRYSGRRVTGTTQRGDSATRPIDAAYPEPVFAFNELDRLVCGLRFRKGLRVVVPLFSEGDVDLEHDTLSVVGETMARGEHAWIIRFADPVIVTRYVVSAGSRVILEATTRQRRSGTLIRQVPETSAPRLDVPTLDGGVHHFRLIPVGRAQSDTTAWSVTREIQPTGSRPSGLQVMISTRGGRRIVDSVLFDPRTLVPLWEHTHGSDTRFVTFANREVTMRVVAEAGPASVVTARTPGPVYSSAMDDLVLQSLPLVPGYRKILSFWDGDRLEIDTVMVRDAPAFPTDSPPPTVLVVNFAEPHVTETLWIDRASRRVVRHEYRFEQSGAVSEVRPGP